VALGVSEFLPARGSKETEFPTIESYVPIPPVIGDWGSQRRPPRIPFCMHNFHFGMGISNVRSEPLDKCIRT